MPTISNYLHQPDIDPVLLHLWGPLQIRWYSLMYVGGFYLATFILRRLSKEPRFHFTSRDADRLVMWALIGGVVSARLGFCLVYDLKSFLASPIQLIEIYNGGLSFHGALLGITCIAVIFARREQIPFWNLADAIALATPTGLAMGRIGNFLNGELFGRVSYVPWAVIFKNAGTEPRHPSQIYEFLLEGVGLFALLWLLKPRLKKDGEIAVTFLIGYSICRFVAECFREPDVQVGYLLFGLTMGQILSILMLALSLMTASYVVRRSEPIRAP